MPNLTPLRLVIEGIERVTGPVRRINASIRSMTRPVRAVSREFDKMGRKLRGIGRTGTIGLTAPILAAATAAAASASTFDTELAKITGLVGVAREQVQAWRGDVLDLAGEVARSPRELAEGLFFVTSAGARGTTALDILRASAQASAAGLGDTATVADAVTSAVNAYGAENLSAAQATGILIAAVREGKASAESLAPVLGDILPLASDLGVGFDQVAASIAAMTRLGADAAGASTSLRAILSSLLKPASESEKMLQRVGLSSRALRQQLQEQGLLAVLETLQRRFRGNKAAIAAVFPNVRALTGVLNLVGKNAENTRAIFGSLASATDEDLRNAFESAAAAPGFKFAQALQRANVLLIRIGDAILPVLLPQLARLTRFVERATATFVGLPQPVKAALLVFGGLLAVLGPVLSAIGFMAQGISVLLPALAVLKGAILSLNLAFAANPIGLVVAGIGLLIVAGVLLIRHWERVRAAALRVFDALSGSPFAILLGPIGAFILAAGQIRKHWEPLTQMFSALWEGIAGTFRAGLEKVRSLLPTRIATALGFDVQAPQVAQAAAARSTARAPAPRLALPSLALPGPALAPAVGPRIAPAVPARSAAARVGGRLDVRITAEGRPQVERIESDSNDFELAVETGRTMRF